MTDYLSKDRDRINALQRARRARMVRVDYMPNPEAVAILQAKRDQQRPGSVSATNSAMLDAIVTDWARLTGIKYNEIQRPMTPGLRPEFSDAYARTNDSGFCHPPKGQAKATGSMVRVACGAQRRRDGLPCQAGEAALQVAWRMQRWPANRHGAQAGPLKLEAISIPAHQQTCLRLWRERSIMRSIDDAFQASRCFALTRKSG